MVAWYLLGLSDVLCRCDAHVTTVVQMLRMMPVSVARSLEKEANAVPHVETGWYTWNMLQPCNRQTSQCGNVLCMLLLRSLGSVFHSTKLSPGTDCCVTVLKALLGGKLLG